MIRLRLNLHASTLHLAVYSFCILLSANHLFAQTKPKSINPEPIFKNFTIDEGLPSNEVYHIVQDSVGYIWIATSNGVSRFDGITFKNYGIDDGLVESTIHEIYPDYKGRLWFISSSGRLAYYKDNRIIPFPFNHRLSEFIPKSRGTVKKSFYVDSLDNVHLSLKSYGRLIISSEGIISHLDSIHKTYSIVVEKIDDGPLLVSSNWLSNLKLEFLYTSKGRTFTIENEKQRSPFHFFVLEESPNTILMSFGGRLHKITDNKVSNTKDFGEEIIWLSKDRHQNLWISPIQGGIHFFREGIFDNKNSMYFLKNYQITSIILDNEGGYWFSTLANGIFYTPNIDILTVNQTGGLRNNRLNGVFVNREGIFIGDEAGFVSQITNNTIIYHQIKVEGLRQLPIRFLGIDSTSNCTWIGTTTHLHSITNGTIKNHIHRTIMTGASPRQMIPAIEGGYWIASSWGIRKFDGQAFTYSSREKEEFSSPVHSVFQDSSQTLWMATDNGVWTYKNGKFEYLGESNPLFSHSTRFITGCANSKILFATKGMGLLVLKGETIHRITEADGLPSNYINKIFVAKNGVWLATSNGISLLRPNLNESFTIQNINISHGLPTNEISDIFVRGNTAYVSSPKGLSIIHVDRLLPNNVTPKTTITSIKANGNELELTSPHLNNLNYSHSFITINYIGLAYKNMSRVNYRYRLANYDSTWTNTRSTTATLSGLRSGKYTFEVQAQNSDGLWGDSAKLIFTIKAPFWQTYWFITLLAFGFTLFIFVVYRLRINSIKRRNELVNNLNIYRQKSLRQQMNPHFIFNTLNSIQLYILEKDHISSHKYLTKFAKLMRLILDNSQVSSIPLRYEIEALKLYLELESIRLSGRFEYSIEVEDETLLETRVPTLLIQPFVENSIWHGIMLKPEKDGWVKISIKAENDSVICTIEDNGVGRKAAQEIRAKQDPERKSLGFKITAQRIDLLNSLYKDRFNIEYTDLENRNGSLGTRVVIRIPQGILEEESGQLLEV